MEMRENIAMREAEIEIDILGIIKTLFRKVWIILLIAAVFGLGAFINVKLFKEPIYVSTAKVYTINTNNSGASFEASYNDLVMAEQLTKDYEEIIKSNYVMNKVIEEMNLDMEVADLAETVTVEAVEDTRILEISVGDKDPVVARDITNKVCEIAGDRIVEVMNIEAINIVDEAQIPEEPSGYSVTMDTLKGFILGGFIAAFLVVIAFLFDNTIKTEEDITNKLGLTNLATIPYNKDDDRGDESEDPQNAKEYLQELCKKAVALFAK